MDLSKVPMLLVMTPFPIPLMTPPLTRMYLSGASLCSDRDILLLMLTDLVGRRRGY